MKRAAILLAAIVAVLVAGCTAPESPDRPVTYLSSASELSAPAPPESPPESPPDIAPTVTPQPEPVPEAPPVVSAPSAPVIKSAPAPAPAPAIVAPAPVPSPAPVVTASVPTPSAPVEAPSVWVRFPNGSCAKTDPATVPPLGVIDATCPAGQPVVVNPPQPVVVTLYDALTGSCIQTGEAEAARSGLPIQGPDSPFCRR